MKQVIIVILISVNLSGIFLSETAGREYYGELNCYESTYYQQTDTINANPYLKIKRFEIDIITPSSGIQFYKNGILYLSSSGSNNNMISQHISFGGSDLFYALVNDSVPGKQFPFDIYNQFDIPAEGISFTNNPSRFYYSKLSERDGKVKIFMAEPANTGYDQTWALPYEPLDFCTTNNYTHPTISSDGNIMIFSSDMPGGAGGLDLYISRFENKIWSAPINMGGRINSPGNELYACFDKDNNLYFSSDGLPGLGGYDIFFCYYNGVDWDDPINLVDQINTDNDEIAFKINRNENNGFYTLIERSRRSKKQINRKLYKIELDEKYNNNYLLSDILKDFAAESSLLAMQKENERLATEERRADSIKIAQPESEKLAADQRRADSIKTAQLEYERLAAEQRRADSIKAAQVRQQQKTITREKVIYRVQCTSSMKAKGSKKTTIGGKEYETYEYFYKGAWRVTIGEFDNLEDAITLRMQCRSSGYNQAFVVAFKNGVRSLDMNLFKR